MILNVFFPKICSVEKGEPRFAGGGETQHSGSKDPRGENEEADAERGVLEEERRGGALEDGNAVGLDALAPIRFLFCRLTGLLASHLSLPHSPLMFMKMQVKPLSPVWRDAPAARHSHWDVQIHAV